LWFAIISNNAFELSAGHQRNKSMPRILIFNGAPDAAQKSIGKFGAPTNETMFSEAVGMHAQPDEPMEFFSINVADGERLPQGMAMTDFDGVTISGSPLNIYHDIPAVRRQIELAREIFHAGVPTFGSCWGLQLMTAALGGQVRLNPRGREIGIARMITLNEAGREHSMYRGKGPAFDALCSHEDEVEALPACGVLLASNAVSRVQAAEMVDGVKSFWGVQYHPEHTFTLAAAIITSRAKRHVAEGLALDEADALRIAGDFRALDETPVRGDLVWKYGVGADVLDRSMRTLEFRNWLDAKVRPYAARRA
jgi:GMP synthase (glutamine-hydrolysing)